MLKITTYGNVTRIDSARTLVGRGRYWTTAYLVDGLLVDSGCAYSAAEMVSAIENQLLTHIINTHSHEDHIGANALLQENWLGLVILAHPLALPILENPRQEQPLQLYRRLLWGMPELSTAHAVQDGELIQTGNHTFQVIYTPGHSLDHICLYEPDRGWLFSGDLFNGGQDRAMRVDYDIWQIIASLKKVSELPLTRMFPGCARVRDDPTQELVQKITYLEEMGQKVSALYNEGTSPKDIARTLFPDLMWIEVFTLGHFTRRSLVEAYLRPSIPMD